MSGVNTLFQSETELEHDVVVSRLEDIAEPNCAPADTGVHPHCEHTISRNGANYAGSHFLVDMWGGKRLDDLEFIEATLRGCVEVCGATLLHVQLHHFAENNGVTGVAMLAESHITLHTWPEFNYAAFDIFMCGSCEPRHAVEFLRDALMPERTEVSEHLRGRVSP